MSEIEPNDEIYRRALDLARLEREQLAAELSEIERRIQWIRRRRFNLNRVAVAIRELLDATPVEN